MKLDWEKLLLGEENWIFMLEVSFRTLVMFFIILIGLRLLGKRGVAQLSVFELVVIISLGSAAGDPMFYKEVGLMVPVCVFTVVVVAYRFTTFLMAKSEKIDDLVEGKAVYLIEDGEFNITGFGKEGLAKDEFFSELRQQGVSHLGQVDTAILETSGNLSIYFYEDAKVKEGLPILPALFEDALLEIPKAGTYACRLCGNVEKLKPVKEHKCEKCEHTEWVKAVKGLRIK
ncbi:DUF421 domain-containing protein [Daejeonella lutea]|uniref:Uncharacterized membrane protein YcaP, DUF421 family n=1 Tax=Daejeonella lutea TaxID=572036 RepID=A0A1T5CWM1_9SPHI|nr:YetF domain-containing protein [Daejeonella lutea]SKB63834.1 Uncharacterized membrane protein YcaP, DUF421 family [Daejeonella lutea]